MKSMFLKSLATVGFVSILAIGGSIATFGNRGTFMEVSAASTINEPRIEVGMMVYTRSEFIRMTNHPRRNGNINFNNNIYTAHDFFNKYQSLSFDHADPTGSGSSTINGVLFLELRPGRTVEPISNTPIPVPASVTSNIPQPEHVTVNPVTNEVNQQPTPNTNSAITQEVIAEPSRYAPFLYTRSEITLPNRRLSASEMAAWIAEYHENGGANSFELELISLINEVRTEHGLNTLEIDVALMMASRFFGQTIIDLDLLGAQFDAAVHQSGPYGGSRGTAEAFGVFDRRGGAGQRSAWTPQEVLNNWMNSLPHRENIMRSTITYVGAGSLLGGEWGVFHYLMFR